MGRVGIIKAAVTLESPAIDTVVPSSGLSVSYNSSINIIQDRQTRDSACSLGPSPTFIFQTFTFTRILLMKKQYNIQRTFIFAPIRRTTITIKPMSVVLCCKTETRWRQHHKNSLWNDIYKNHCFTLYFTSNAIYFNKVLSIWVSEFWVPSIFGLFSNQINRWNYEA